jgi:hypothetical protein
MGLGLGGIKKLNQLDRGMSQAQVRALLGEPKQKELKGGKTILKYSLHEWMRGWKPVYLVFDAADTLFEWYVNEDEYMKMQNMMMDAVKFSMPKGPKDGQ